MLNFLEKYKQKQRKEIAFLLTIFVFLLSFVTSSSPVFAFNPEINYQGKLADSLGVTVPDGEYNMRFWLLTDDVIATTSALWTESRTTTNRVQVKNGLFSIMLGSVTPLADLDFNQTLYLGVEIGGADITPNWDGEMSPRKIIGAVPAAFVAERALSADTISGLATSSFLRSDEAGILSATTSSTSTLLTLIQNGTGSLLRLLSSSTEVLTVLNNGNLGLGTTTPNSKLTIQGTGGDNNPTFTIASSSGETTLSMLADGNLELPGQLISAGIKWSTSSVVESNNWSSVIYGNGLFVAVSYDGTNQVMTSPDGINWTARTAAEQNFWNSVTYGNGLFVAVAGSGTNRVMTSPDGINWTARSTAENNSWKSITYGNGLFVAVADSGTNRVMTSPDGINWMARSAAEQNGWYSITYGNGLFVAVSYDGTNQVMTSPDGINWTARTAAEQNFWNSVTYGNGLFVAVAGSGTNRVMTSPDGINWTARTAAEQNFWNSVTYGNGLFVAVSETGTHRVMTSPDGINWTARTAAEQNGWYSITYGNGLFVAVSYDGTNQVMTSGTLNSISLAHNNIYQGGMSIYDSLRIGTTTSSIASLLVQGTPDKNPFVVASSSGDSLLTLDKKGNLGIGTSSPLAKLTVAGKVRITEDLLVSGTTTTEELVINGTTTASNIFAENLSLGTTTTSSLAKLVMEGLDFNVAGVVGFDQNFTLKTADLGAVQIANNLLLKNTNTATTTVVGGLWKIEDSTSFGNTVRGLEIQTDRGTNTLGENTALSGFARTFGVRGTTEGDAGALFEPAGIYGETRGTTQGNALRGYSSTITTAALFKLFQDTSDFTGTGLLMNFGNSGGDFSSSTSKFIDLQNAGTSVFSVGAFGDLRIGDGTTNHLAGVAIGFGGLCVDNDGSCVASTSGRIAAVDYYTGNSDLAEMYFSDEDLKTGEVVYLKEGLSVGLASTSNKAKVLGVVSTKPGLLLGHDDSSLNEGEKSFPIALAGRVPIKLSNENGEIKAGDELMLSSIPGVAMKASSTGFVIGRALEDFDEERAYSDTFINQFGDDLVNPVVVSPNKDTDPRIDDGCYFGGGNAFGEAECVPQENNIDSLEVEDKLLSAYEEEKITLEALREELSEIVLLENGDEVKVGQIVMFVETRYRYLDEEGIEMVQALLEKGTLANGNLSEETLWQRLVNLARNFVDGVLSVFTLKAERVEVSNELCVDGVCVTADDLRRLLEVNGGGGQQGEVYNEGESDSVGEESGEDKKESNEEEGVEKESDEEINNDEESGGNTEEKSVVDTEGDQNDEEIIEENTEDVEGLLDEDGDEAEDSEVEDDFEERDEDKKESNEEGGVEKESDDEESEDEE